MSNVVEAGRIGVLTPSSAEAMEEAAWQAWRAKGLARDQRGYARRIKALKWILAAVLLAAAGVWAQPAPYEIAFRLTVTVGAFVLMIQAFRARTHIFTALFGATAWLYNPLAPVFGLTDDWQRAVVLATTLPLFLSLRWGDTREARK